MLSLGQQRIVEKLEKLNGEFNIPNQCRAPSAPTFFVVRPKSKAEMIGKKQQKVQIHNSYIIVSCQALLPEYFQSGEGTFKGDEWS
jgi:hypothetical protein